MQPLPHTRFTKSFSLLMIVIAYLFAYALAAFSIKIMAPLDWHPIWKLAVADAVGTLVIYFFSVGFKNSSFYDAYWSVAPPVFLVFLIPLSDDSVDGFRQLLLSVAVIFWSVRLTYNWVRGWPGIKHEDWRYGQLKKKGGFSAFIADFLGIHFFPTFMVFMACLPFYPTVVDQQGGELNVFDLLAFAVCIIAVGIELIADEQLRLFKKRIDDPQEFMKSGIWKYSRHPNYFGEWLFWLGIYLFGLIANPDYWWTGIGMLLMLCMFVFASIPLMDNRMKTKRPEYAEHMRKVSAFFPMPHR